MDLKRSVTAVSAVAVSAAALFFATGLHPIWWLTWFAAVPVLAMSTRVRATWAWLGAFVAWSVGVLNMWHYHRVLVQVPLPLTLAAIFGPACVFAFAVVLFRRSLLRGAWWSALLVVPSLWVAFEYLSEFRSPHSTFGNLGYSQMNFPPILQIASITGIWGISFCIWLFSATLAALLPPAANRSQKTRIACVGAGILVVVLGFGFARLYFTPASPILRVGLVASDVPANLAPKGNAIARTFDQYATRIDKLAANGARVVIIPEKTAIAGAANLATLDRILENAASRNHVIVIAGVLKRPGTHNEARVYSPDGALAATYDKHHLLPVFESDEIPGTSRTILRQRSGVWGLAICKDMDFPKLSRQYGDDGAGLLLVPAWDFVADGWLHGRMAILRGVESGFSIARSVKQGVLTVSDDRGRVLAQRDTSEAPFTTLLAAIPVHHDATFYARFGDWFAWLDLALLVVALFASTSNKIRQP